MRIRGNAVQPVDFAGLLLAFGALGKRPQAENLPRRGQLHNELILGRAAQVGLSVDPGHRRRAASPNLVLGGDPQSPGHEQIAPLVEKLPALVEHLDADVIAVGHVQPALRVTDDRMRQAELAAGDPQLAPLFDELPPAIEVDDAIVAVAVGDEHLARRGDCHVGRLVQVRLIAARDAARARRLQKFPRGSELHHHVVAEVGDPSPLMA